MRFESLVSVDANTPVLTGSYWPWIGGIALLFLGVGALLLWREHLSRKDPQRSSEGPETPLVRAWAALGLVGGLLVLTTASLFGSDSQLRSLLVGGIVASGGTALAFYFASRGAEKTQQNLLNAAFGTPQAKVPEVKDMTEDQAKSVLEAVGFRFALGSAGKVTRCEPASGSYQAVGTVVTTYGA